MLQIVTDSSTLYTIDEAKLKNLYINYLQVTIDGVSYREFEDISSEQFVELLKKGHIPSSSQPTLGEVLNTYNSFDENDDVLVITLADGLSGTYSTAVMATLQAKNPERFLVVNSKTLCGPHRYLVDQALRLRDEGKSKEEIVFYLSEKIKTTKSFLIPVDFKYLQRGGRLTPLAATIGSMLHLRVSLITSEDGKKLDRFTLARSTEIITKRIVKKMKELGLDDDYIIYVAHGQAGKEKDKIIARLKKDVPNNIVEVIDLSPAFITQGGPGCIAVQFIKK